MPISAEFSVEGSSVVQAHSVTYGQTVDLALLSLTDARTIQWSVAGTSHASLASPTITPAGVPTGATASFVFPSDPGDGKGRSVVVKLHLTGNGGTTATAYRVVGVPNGRGHIPVAVGEETFRSATHGWVEVFNDALAGVASLPALANPADNAKTVYGFGGAYVVKPAGHHNVQVYGAAGDNSTDDTAAIQAAIDAAEAEYSASGEVPVVLFPPGIYRHTGLEITDFGVHLLGYGATLVRTTDNEGILVSMSWTNVQSISAISSQAVDLAGDGTGNTTVSRLTVTDASAYAAGDWVKVVSDDVHSSVASGNEREGEFARVSSVNAGSNFVFLTSVLEFAANYVTAPRLAKMTYAHQVTIEGLSFDYAVVASSTKEELKIVAAYEPRILNCTIRRSLGVALKLNGTLRATTQNFTVLEVSTAVGYGVLEASSEHSHHYNLRGTECRHVFTTGVANTSAGSAAIQDFGRTKYAVVYGGEAWHCWKEGLDTHPDAYHCTFYGFRVRDTWIGPSGGRRCINIEGIGNRLIGCETFGSCGITFNNTQTGKADGARDNEAVGCKHNFKAPDDTSVWGFGVLSVDTLARGNRFTNCSVDVNGTIGIPFLVSTFGEAIITNPYVRWNATAAGTANAIRLNGDAVCRVRGGIIDCTGSSTTTLRPFAMTANGASLFVDGTEIVTGGATINRYLETSSTNSNATLDTVCDGAPTALINGTPTGTIWIRNGTSRARSSLGTSRSYTIATGAITIQTPHVVVDTEAAAATDDLDTINGGAEGDVIVVRSATGSRDPTLKDGTGNLVLAGDCLLDTTSDMIQLMKVGSNWVEISRSNNA